MTSTIIPREYFANSGQSRYVDVWNEVLSREFAGKVFTPAQPDDFRAELRCRSTDDGFLVAHAQSSAAKIGHEQSHVVEQTAREFILHYQMSGLSLNVQAGREAILRPGDFTFCDTGRPYSIEFQEPTDVLVLRFRRERLLSELGAMDDLVAVPVLRENPGAALFSNLIETFWGRSVADDWLDIDRSLENAMLSLLQLAYKPVIVERSGERMLHAARWTEAVRYIDGNLADAQLSVGAVSAQMGVSPRYLQSLFARRGETFTSYVRGRRLERAAQLLLNPGPNQETVMGVCLDCGFNDLSYFTREFRQRFGTPPARYRSTHLSQ